MFNVFRLARTTFPGREDKSFVGVHDGKSPNPANPGTPYLIIAGDDCAEIALMSWHTQREWLFPTSLIT
jgi:hypothetical protein